ncbi:hypothetical protein TRAPUB_8163 [Trametes pubescens]|uniref:Chromatin modification-related protein EAF7 n=1 Tax=Trametes pubescens TaxID=154538 RepID=A0A1M2W5V1_TRAPU|nr:hypothetical protein TRAPUB_8163 [Trametes pubescens]
MSTKMEVDDDNEAALESRWLDSVEGEIAFFRSLMRARPVGIHRHFHVLTMRNAILRDTGELVAIDDLWAKLRTCYDLDILENIEADGYDFPGEGPASTPPLPPRSPSPSDNLSMHPFFRHEYTLPHDETFETIMSERRMRASVSLPSSSPAPSPVTQTKSGRGGRKGKSKLKHMAGLVGGDSDSSALTQESGDESVAPTPRDSVATGTDAGTEYAEDEEEPRQSPAASIASKQPRKGTKGTGRGRGRGRGAAAGGSRGTKRKKK